MKILKWTGIILLTVGLILVAFFYLKVNQTNNRFEAVYDVTPAELKIPNDSLSLAIGAKWVQSLCTECHAPDLGGKLFFEDPEIGKVFTPNLTPGAGGLSYYQDDNWIKALRHGVATTGRPLFIMPSKDYQYFNKEDLVSIIAYIKTVSPVDRENGQTELQTFAKFLIGIGAFGEVFSAEKIDHSSPIPNKPASQTVLERGNYLVMVAGCATCHGPDLKGMKSPNPNSPTGADLTATGNLANWDNYQFTDFTKTGRTPEGKEVNNEFMPWQVLGRLGEDDVEAIFSYLKTLD